MRHLLLFLFSLLPTFLWADNIPVEKAQELAITFFKEGHPQRSAFSSLRLLVTDEAVSARAVGEAPAYYVFGCTGSEGFVIVAGDDAVMPVLGYSFDSSFPQTDLPVNLKFAGNQGRDSGETSCSDVWFDAKQQSGSTLDDGPCRTSGGRIGDG